MDQEEFQYQVNYLLTVVLKNGTTYPLSPNETKSIVSFTNDSRHGSSRLFTTTLKATPIRVSINSVMITPTLLNILAKKAGRRRP
jgi:hypothetical protein